MQSTRQIRLPRFYPILDTALLASRGLNAEDAASAILDAGARIIQFRHKEYFGREMFATAERVAELCRAAGAVFVVNDRADMAAILHAALHLGQDDLRPSEARRVTGPDALIGFSTHNEAQLAAAGGEPVNYVALGPIFATASKHNPDPVVGVEALRRLRPLSRHPLVAIGGITRTTALAALEAGADAVAVISDALPDQNTLVALRERTREWLDLVR